MEFVRNHFGIKVICSVLSAKTDVGMKVKFGICKKCFKWADWD